MNKIGEKYKILVLPDHPTPLDLRTHTRDAVPYVLYDSTNEKDSIFSSYTEENAKKAAKYYDKGCKLLSEFLK